MFNFSGSEIVFLLLLALIVLGPEKLPEAVRRFGKTYAEFKKVTTGFQSELKQALDEPMREMRETADAIKKAASFDVDTKVFTDPFGRAVSSADQPASTVQPDAATDQPSADQPPADQPTSDQAAVTSQPVPGPAPVPLAADAAAESAAAESAAAESAAAADPAPAGDDPPPATSPDDPGHDGAAPE